MGRGSAWCSGVVVHIVVYSSVFAVIMCSVVYILVQNLSVNVKEEENANDGFPAKILLPYIVRFKWFLCERKCM
ncbi:hypothetical protein Tcan_05523 [Toxocara canis]|uniref:Uncharacterized protein n=1 Tax=Toxocara canis TaxID=6265 RepID=A0A0B2V2Y1_TOXCA|nr:hypothetical protein Tcan_05523 [Toxocara canis]